MNREDIERLANNLRQINAFGKGGDTNRKRVEKEVIGKNYNNDYNELTRINDGDNYESGYYINASDLPIEDQERLINAGTVFHSGMPSFDEDDAIVVTPNSKKYSKSDFNQAYNAEKEWLRDWFAKQGFDNNKIKNKLNRTPIYHSNKMEDNVAGYYHDLFKNIHIRDHKNVYDQTSTGLHELTHAIQDELGWLNDNKILQEQVKKALGNKRYSDLYWKNFDSENELDRGSYYYSPKEIQARLNEIRYDLDLSPLKNDIDKIKDEQLENQKIWHNFEELSNDELRRLLKEVTYNDNNYYNNIAAYGGKVNKYDNGGGVKRKKLTAAQENMIYSLENSDMLPTFNQFSDDLSNTTAQQYMLDIAYNPKRWFENTGEAEARRAWARSNNLGFDELAYGLLDKKDQKSKEVTSKMPTDWRTKEFADRVRQAMNKNSMFMTDVIESMPIVGDVAQAVKAGNYFANGETGKGMFEAGMLGAGFVLPNVVEKAIRKSPLGKKLEKAAINNADDIYEKIRKAYKEDRLNTDVNFKKAKNLNYLDNDLVNLMEEINPNISNNLNKDEIKWLVNKRTEEILNNPSDRVALHTRDIVDGLEKINLLGKDRKSIGDVTFEPVLGGTHIGMIKNLTEGSANRQKGVSEDLYNAILSSNLKNPLVVGESLLMPERTLKVYDKFKKKPYDKGTHLYKIDDILNDNKLLKDAFRYEIGKPDYKPTSKQLGDYAMELLKLKKDLKMKEAYVKNNPNTPLAESYSLYIMNNERRNVLGKSYELKKPTHNIPTKSQFFQIDNTTIDQYGYPKVNWDNNNIFKIAVPTIGAGYLLNSATNEQ